MIEILSGTWVPGETKTYHVSGERFEILDAPFPLDVYLLDKSGVQRSIMKNSEASFFCEPREGFSSLQIRSEQAQEIRFFVGSGDAGTRRISSTVTVIDSVRERVNAGAAFAACFVVRNAQNYATAQLWNPPGSGRRLVVDRVGASRQEAGSVFVSYSTDFAGNEVSDPVCNKRSGSSRGVAQLRKGGSARWGNEPMCLAVIDASPGANGEFRPVGPVVLEPGFGLYLWGAGLSQDIVASFEWSEEAI
jgi:hypothetical protein